MECTCLLSAKRRVVIGVGYPVIHPPLASSRHLSVDLTQSAMAWIRWSGVGGVIVYQRRLRPSCFPLGHPWSLQRKADSRGSYQCRWKLCTGNALCIETLYRTTVPARDPGVEESIKVVGNNASPVTFFKVTAWLNYGGECCTKWHALSTEFPSTTQAIAAATLHQNGPKACGGSHLSSSIGLEKRTAKLVHPSQMCVWNNFHNKMYYRNAFVCTTLGTSKQYPRCK